MDGQLGNNELGSSNTPVDVIGLDSSIAVIEGGGFHTCALTTEGGIKCWGDNRHGQLGDGTIATRFMPVDVSGLSSGITAITAGLRHTCALTTDGGMKCWGNNEYGQLGDGTTINRSTPVNVSGLSSGVVAISSGWDYTCALITDGGVKCWGKNEYGQLGDGTRTNRSKPTNVIGLSCYGLTLSANSASAGTLTASPVNSSGCVGPWKYKAGKVITFSASPKLYYHFDRWSSTLVNPTTKRMTMPAANIRIVGYFGTNLRQGTYNDTYATGIDHTSTWLTQSSALFYGGTQHYTVTRGSTITINFTGTRLGMYYTQRKTYGRVTIQIDARAAVLLNENALTTGYRKLWWSPVLASGNHKAVITYYAGNPVNTPVNFDGVVVQ
jgi:hypothetical protein